MNMKLTNDLAKKDDCKHSFAAKVLERMTKAETLDLSEQDQVFVVQKKPKLVAVVYPKKERCDSKGATARPGVIEKNTSFFLQISKISCSVSSRVGFRAPK